MPSDEFMPKFFFRDFGILVLWVEEYISKLPAFRLQVRGGRLPCRDGVGKGAAQRLFYLGLDNHPSGGRGRMKENGKLAPRQKVVGKEDKLFLNIE